MEVHSAHSHSHTQSAIIVYRWMMEKVSHKEYTAHICFFVSRYRTRYTCMRYVLLAINCSIFGFKFHSRHHQKHFLSIGELKSNARAGGETRWKTFAKHCPQFILIDMIVQYLIRAHLCRSVSACECEHYFSAFSVYSLSMVYGSQ